MALLRTITQHPKFGVELLEVGRRRRVARQIEHIRNIIALRRRKRGKIQHCRNEYDPVQIDPKAAVLLTPENRELIGRLRLALEAVTPWTAETTEAAVRAFAEQNNLKLGAAAQPLRVALTGRTTSPGIFDVLAVLGRAECLARLGDQAP